ncbi:MAG: aminotransferase class IV [Desulfobacteraceae bacterium]|nr:aminotransferase class IV [Desulfobacteraceae bacterium]
MTVYYVDGKFVPDDQAMIPVDDLAVLRGFGICDIMRTFHGKPYFIDEHIQRLMDSAKQIGLLLPWKTDEIKAIVLETLQKNKPTAEANIRIVITGGSSPDFLTPSGNPRLIVMVTPQAQKSGAVEALYINSQKQVLEGTTSNLFAFFGNTLVTPPAQGILKGITRKLILSLGAQFFQITEEPLFLNRLTAADEVFITGTNKGVVPVIQIDDAIISNGRPGKNTAKLIQALDQHTRHFSSR